jgi:hypothetical protein
MFALIGNAWFTFWLSTPDREVVGLGVHAGKEMRVGPGVKNRPESSPFFLFYFYFLFAVLFSNSDSIKFEFPILLECSIKENISMQWKFIYIYIYIYISCFIKLGIYNSWMNNSIKQINWKSFYYFLCEFQIKF